ncbi:hypothetical protein BLTE_04840 [Blastochloris tepida]|uniref:Uncharacterized protein n=1 Tax=Blastochloris tepida TaxID=2233851 RepID=A0A348FWW6_9HYPH|nr:hypothetical protein BLTE_04840 [Blastochloris tepida]
MAKPLTFLAESDSPETNSATRPGRKCTIRGHGRRIGHARGSCVIRESYGFRHPEGINRKPYQTGCAGLPCASIGDGVFAATRLSLAMKV